jgi:hypothetical protein
MVHVISKTSQLIFLRVAKQFILCSLSLHKGEKLETWRPSTEVACLGAKNHNTSGDARAWAIMDCPRLAPTYPWTPVMYLCVVVSPLVDILCRKGFTPSGWPFQ